MHILIANKAKIPVFAYGGTERVIWDLGYALTQLGHKVTFAVTEGSHCDFAEVVRLDKKAPIKPQLPKGADVVHFQFQPDFDLDTDFDRPYLMTEHGNANKAPTHRSLNTVFITQDHARRHNSDQYIYNGLNWDSYGPVDWDMARSHFHFLGKAAWSVKNVRGAIDVARDAKVTLAVLGGYRLNVSRGFRLTLTPRARFYGMVGGEVKFKALNQSRGHIFPVRWHEPFGLAMIESLYFGAPVFGTPYGSLNELITPEVGYLSNARHELADAVKSMRFDAKACHAHALTNFDAMTMAKRYVEKYERVIAGEKLNPAEPFLTDKSGELLPWLP